MKALIVTHDEEVMGPVGSPNYYRVCMSALQANQIEWNNLIIDKFFSVNASEAAKINADYDAIVLPYNAGGYNVLIDDANITIPIVSLGAFGSNASLGATSGVGSNATAQADRWMASIFTAEKMFAAHGRSFAAGTGTPLVTVASTEPGIGSFGSTVQTDAGDYVLWSTERGGGVSRLYCSAWWPEAHGIALALLLQMAVNEGELLMSDVLSTRFRRAPMVHDLDHVNAAQVNIEPEILDVLADFVGNGTMWCGIWNGNSADFDNMPQTTIDRIKKYHGKFKYCWHDHVFSPIIVEGQYPNLTNVDDNGYSTDVSKTQLVAQYEHDKAVWDGLGLPKWDYPGYGNWGSNSWDEGSLELFSRNISHASSPLNDTAIAGYGLNIMRCIRASTRAQPTKTVIHHNQYANQNDSQGIMLVSTWDLSFDIDMPYNSIADWRQQFRYISQTVTSGMSLYGHPADFVAADQSPGTIGKQHGIHAIRLFADIGRYAKDFTDVFADPTKYVL